MKTIQIGMGWFPQQAGGLNRVYYDCYHYLPAVGIEIKGLVAGLSEVNQETQGKIQAFAPSNASVWQRWLKMRNYFEIIPKQDYDLIAAHFPLYTFPIIDKCGAKPLVVHFHGPWSLEGQKEGNTLSASKLKWWLEKVVYSKAKRFIVLSEAFQKVLEQNYQINREKIRIIPGGVDLDRFQIQCSTTEARERLNLPTDRPIIFAVRRLAQRMGLENLIEAIAQIKIKYPDILLLIGGKGVLYESLQQQIEALELTNHVRLLGFVPEDNLKVIYRAANFSLVPTIALEGFGLTVIESLAVGTPVMGTPIGGIPEILRPLSEDLVFTDASVEALAQGIIEVLSGARQLPTQEQCQAYVRQNYAWSVIAEKMKTAYQEVIDSD